MTSPHANKTETIHMIGTNAMNFRREQINPDNEFISEAQFAFT
jgi:hypothetical protein